jgi:hypothetical protein
MTRKKSESSASLSACLATILFFGIVVLDGNKMSIWNELGKSEKGWTIFATVYAGILVMSGWIYYGTCARLAGISHATLMLGVCGIILCIIVNGGMTSPGPDNAAGGILTAVNMVFLVCGVLTGSLGVAVLRSLFSEN